MKQKRHMRILELIQNNNIETQEELLDKLTESGFPVTQATVSRDIRELNLTKLTMSDGRQKYVPYYERTTFSKDKYVRVIKDGYHSMNLAQNLMILKTATGMASAVAAAIDALDFPEILGSVAGDDCIFCACATENEARNLIEKLQQLIY